MIDIEWGSHLRLRFVWADEGPVRLVALLPGSVPAALEESADQPLVELSAFGHGRSPGGFRHVDTIIGRELRHLDHTIDEDSVRVRQHHAGTGLVTTSVFERTGPASLRTWTEVTHEGTEPLVLDFVSSFATGSLLPDSGRPDVDGLDLLAGANDWVAESRWTRRPLRQVGLARIDRELQHHPPRSRYQLTNRGSWSTGEALPTAVVLDSEGTYALAFQVEHNGPWTHEVGETRTGAYVLASGPTDAEHQWSDRLAPGETFVSVPVGVAAVRGGVDEAFAALTRHRRAIRRRRPADDALPIVFNDYMNTLMGDPTTQKVLPLVAAAADVGADTFCVDAGWYAEGTWWDSVGEWEPAASRFPGGLGEVIDAIRDRGMAAGLWLEPEVIGVNSPLARTLPEDAFVQRRGVRVAEHGRHLLDFTSSAARAHVTEVVDRIVGGYGATFIKMDYNTMPGPGTDRAGQAPGEGLLAHARALLDWFDEAQAAHPDLLIESCASGAMRMDYATLSRLHMQSTSDQQDPVMYAPIAAAAPASILPEQAGNWAYPVAGQERELFVLSLVNGILGRVYLSGHLNRMSEAELDTVRAAMAAHRRVLGTIEQSTPFWPWGLPGWEDPWVAFGLRTEREAYLTVWRRTGSSGQVELPLPWAAGRRVQAEWLFPDGGEGWSATAGDGVVRLSLPADLHGPSARVLRLTH